MGNTERVQAVLNWKYFREKDALKVRKHLLDETSNLPDDNNGKWTDRNIMTEALIALGEKLYEGWQPTQAPSEVTISAGVAEMFNQLQGVVAMLSDMDIDQLRQVKGFDENTFNTLKNEGLKRGGAKMFSDDTVFESEDW